MCHLVARRPQDLIFFLAIEVFVDHALWMFHTKSDSKRLRLHINAAAAQHLKSIPRAVAESQHADLCRDLFFVVDLNGFQSAILKDQVRHCRFKTETSAHCLDLMAKCFYDPDQYIGSEMWFLLVDDLLRSSGFYKSFQNFMVTSVWILDQSVQLSIRKSSCSTLAELHIGVRVQNAIFPEMIYRFFSFGRHLSPFEDKRTVSCPCQIPRAEKSGRSAADDDRWMNQLRTSWFREMISFLFC